MNAMHFAQAGCLCLALSGGEALAAESPAKRTSQAPCSATHFRNLNVSYQSMMNQLTDKRKIQPLTKLNDSTSYQIKAEHELFDIVAVVRLDCVTAFSASYRISQPADMTKVFLRLAEVLWFAGIFCDSCQTDTGKKFKDLWLEATVNLMEGTQKPFVTKEFQKKKLTLLWKNKDVGEISMLIEPR